MKKIGFALVFILLFGLGISQAQVLTLNAPEALAVPTATHIDFANINIDITNLTVTVRYKFLDSLGRAISISGASGTTDRFWYCRDIPVQLAADCAGAGVPYAGCTGAGTGTGLNPGSTCFTDTVLFQIRTEDAGTLLGKGLRALLWARMRSTVLTGANDATLP